MPRQDIIRMIDDCKACGVPSIELGAGIETFLYPGVDQIMRYIAEKDFEDFWISTNGVLLDDARADLVLDTNVTRLRISIDAASPQTYAKSRGGSYHKLMKNIFQFLEKKEKRKAKLPIIRVSFVKFNLTEHEAENFVRFWQPLVDDVDVQNLIDVKNVNELRYDSIEPSQIHCKYPSNMLWIDWNGDYRPCCTDFSKLVKIGNIKDMGILEAWKCKKISDLRAQLNQEQPLNKACLNCLRSIDSKEQYGVDQKIK